MSKLSCQVRLCTFVHNGNVNVRQFSAQYEEIEQKLTRIYQSGGKVPKIGFKIGEYKIIGKTSDDSNIFLEVEKIKTV